MTAVVAKKNGVRQNKATRPLTIEIPGPVESFDAEESWDWPNWPNGPVGAAQTGGRGVKPGRPPGDAGLNPMYYSFATSRTLLQQMRTPLRKGKGRLSIPINILSKMKLRWHGTSKPPLGTWGQTWWA